MIKKLLLILFIFCTSHAFAQNTEVGNGLTKTQLPAGKTISDVTAFPNPLTSKSVISFYSASEQVVIFEVKNVLGKSVFKQSFLTNFGTNEITFQKENLTPGMYIYSIQTDAEIVSKRLVIK